MVYEYFDVKRKGQFDQWVQGEGLDTMHDGAWFAAALVNAYGTTGDEYYKDFLTDWVLPFYLTMLNHSDELFTAKGAVVREGGRPWGKISELPLKPVIRSACGPCLPVLPAPAKPWLPAGWPPI